MKSENKGFQQAAGNILLRAIPLEIIVRFLVSSFGVDSIKNENSAAAQRTFVAANVAADWTDALFAKYPLRRN